MLYLSVISDDNVLVYEQFLSQKTIEKNMIDTINNIALGLKNTMDLVLSSINYLDFTVYFMKGLDFTIVLITSGTKQLNELVSSIFDSFQNDTILEIFSEFASKGVLEEDNDLKKRITKIINNLTFFYEVNDLRDHVSY